MGLDVSIYSAPKNENAPELVRGEYLWGDLKEECYWRKNFFINSFFGDIYYEKQKDDNPDFNGVLVRLTLEKVQELKKRIQRCSRDAWASNSLEHKKYPTLKQLRKLLSDMKENKDTKIYYGVGSW